MKINKQLPHDYEKFLKEKMGLSSERETMPAPKKMYDGGMVDEDDYMEDEMFDDMGYPNASPNPGDEELVSGPDLQEKESDKSSFAKALRMRRRMMR